MVTCVVELTGLANTAGFASVHVTVVNKSAKGTAGEASSSNREERFKGCQCTIM